MEKKVTKQNSFLTKIINKKNIIIISSFIFLLLIIGAFLFFFTPLIKKDNISNESIELFQKAKQQYLEKKLDDCIITLNSIIRKNKKFLNARFLLGKAYFFNNHADLAQKAWEDTLKINPNHINSLIWLGILYSFDPNQLENSIKLFNASSFLPRSVRIFPFTNNALLAISGSA